MKQQFHTWFNTKNSFQMKLLQLFKPNLWSLVFLMGLFLLLTQAANAQISGTVFRDFNSNGTMDNTVTYNEIGLAGYSYQKLSTSKQVIF